MLDTQFPLLLHSFVQDTPPELDGLWNIPHLWRTAVEQNLLPVLAYENKRWKLFDDPNVCRQLDGLLYGTVAANLNRCVDFETLSAGFTAHGIAHMPVKGYYLRKLYPTPELRTFGDIDLLIHPEDRQKVHNLMLSLGYTVKQDWEPTYSYIKDAEYYEIHTNLMDGNLDGRTDLQAYFDAAWAHAEPDDGLRFRPEDDFHFIYTVCHLAKHLYGGGAGLRMYLDVALYVMHKDDSLHWQAIAGEFVALHLAEFFYTVMNACRVWFGTKTTCPLPEPDTEALDRLLSYTLDSDLFGHSRDHAVIELRNEKGESPSRSRVLRKMLFPPAAEIESRYTFLRNRHWLLPLAWFVRLFANLRLIPSRIRQMKQVTKTDKASVETYDGFMRRIGL